MKVREVMTDQVQFCAPEMNLAAATELMWNNDCGVLPVVEGGKLTGIITDRDMCIALGTRDLPASHVAVRDVETTEVETCGPDDDVHKAMEVMRRAKVRRIPVVDEERAVLGILSLNDIALRVERKHGDLTYDEVLNTMKAVAGHRSRKPAAPAVERLAMAAAS